MWQVLLPADSPLVSSHLVFETGSLLSFRHLRHLHRLWMLPVGSSGSASLLPVGALRATKPPPHPAFFFFLINMNSRNLTQDTEPGSSGLQGKLFELPSHFARQPCIDYLAILRELDILISLCLPSAGIKGVYHHRSVFDTAQTTVGSVCLLHNTGRAEAEQSASRASGERNAYWS